MNIQFGEKDPTEVEHEESLIIDGKNIGFMKTYARGRGSRYHAGINLGPGSISLIQGHGETKEEAIINAIEKGRADAHKLLLDIDLFETKLNGGING